MEFVYAFLIAMLISMAVLPFLVYLGNRFAFVDQPSPRKVHSSPIPRSGGPAIALGSVLAVFLVGIDYIDRQVVALLLAGMVVLVVGLVDDRTELGYKPKFLAQFAAAGIVVYFGDISLYSLTVPNEWIIPDLLSQPLSFLIIVALMNAVALSDGLDGLAGGIVFLCCLALCVLGYVSLNNQAALIAIAVAGSIFGFLRFNTHPASVFMGDSGSQFIGLMSAVLALFVTQSGESRISSALPLFLLAIPIIDTVQVAIHRIRMGKSPFVADKNHLHHRLLGLGLKHHQAVLISYLVQCMFFLLAYFMRYQSDLLVISVFLAAAACLLALLAIAEAAVRIGKSPPEGRQFLDQERRSRLSVDAKIVAGLLVVIYAAILVAQSSTTPLPENAYSLSTLWQVRGLTVLLLLALAVAAFTRNQPLSETVVTAVGYVTAAVVAFLASSVAWESGVLESLEHVTIAAIGIVCGLSLGLSNRKGVQLTTLDTLILFGAIAVPSLPGLLTEQEGVAMLVIRLVIFFYAAEVLAAVGPRNRILPLAATLGLVVVHLQFISTSL